MIKENSVTGKYPVTLPVVHHRPVAINLGYGVGTARSERGAFILGRRSIAKHLTGRRLVEFGLDAASPDCLQ